MTNRMMSGVRSEGAKVPGRDGNDLDTARHYRIRATSARVV
jgi:hypothetical protein